MKIWTVGLLFSGLALLAGSACAQEDMRRFKLTPLSEMTPAQRAYANAVMSGPVAATGSAAVVPGAGTIGSPFNVYLRSPALAERLRQLGEQIRFRSSLPARLNEFAILVTARHWTAQYEWHAHHRLALKAGLNPVVAEDLAQGRRPAGMQEDDAVSDVTFKAAVEKFGEQGVVDLIAVNGYYVLVSMILNVDRTPIPGGGKPPLPLLK